MKRVFGRHSMTIPFPLPTRQLAIDIQEDRCVTILWIVRCGWARVLATGDVDATWDEVPITERLRREMDATAASLDKDVWVHEGMQSTSRVDVRRPDGLTDIPISFTSIKEKRGGHPHAIIECKRVAENNSELCREYVDEGIRRFVSGSRSDPNWPKYASTHAAGFMVGYLLSGSVVGVVGALNSRLPESQYLRPSAILQQEWARTSEHRRTSPLGAIALHHVFLSVMAGAA